MRGVGGLAAVGLAGLAAAAAMPPAHGAAGPGAAATIGQVEDGRTLWLQAPGGAPTRVRLAWIAVPGPAGAKAAGDAPAREARRRLEVWKGQPVERVDVGRDRDGVPLVELLWRPTPDSVVTLNYEMVRSGFSRADCAPTGAYALQCHVLRRAEEVARRERRGVWATP